MFRAGLRLNFLSSNVSRELLPLALKACGILKELEVGKKLHANVVEFSDLCISNALITMYSKCDDMENARNIFEKMSRRDVVSWNSIILRYVANSQADLALHCFERLQREDELLPNTRTFVAALVSCSTLASREQGKLVDGKVVKMNTLQKGRLIHSHVTRAGYDTDVYLSNTLVIMYGSCGSLVEARSVFEKMVSRTLVSWNSIIHTCVENGEPELALEFFQRMKLGGNCRPNARSFVAGIRACASLALREIGQVNVTQEVNVKVAALERGKKLHREAEENGLEKELYVGNSLIDLYGKCGSLEDAKLAFQAMHEKNVISWNVLLQAHADAGDELQLENALHIFDCMKAEGLPFNSRTLIAMLMVCANLAVRNKARKSFCHRRGSEIHRLAVSSGFHTDLYVASTTIDMFSRCGSMSDAREVFDGMVNRDIVTWNALITGYVKNEQHELSLEAYGCMRREGGEPDSLTFVSVLTSCSHLLEIQTGRLVHADVNRYGLGTDVHVSNCLVDLYGKCGRMTEAVELFESVINRDLVTWSSLMEGFSRQGRSDRVLEVFSRMEAEESFKPDAIMFSAVLTACSHAGLVDKGLDYFNAMRWRYGVEPDMDNFHCMVDLLGRANRVEAAVRLVKSMPYEPNAVTWTTILGACRKWKDVRRGTAAFESLVKLENGNSGAYSLMAELHAL